MNERTIFIAALDIDDPAQRWEYLDESCRGNLDLRKRVEALIHSHEQAVSFLNSPPPGIETTDILDTRAVTEIPGDTIGPYKLLQQIGEGGMGMVFMAEQTEPIQRTVALKIIKPGMDTRQVIARFEAERQALAMMDHPNIAKVLDAGTTDTGRPYFVMELVKGVPITKYCDDKQLSLRERLELFMHACQAVQHAHQKGIIHRDLKPTNVLVAEYDNRAVPKVIDFGVAKAMAQKLTERTLFTEFGQVVGTLEYMSPEQAKLNQLDIDTRSDIYSLGVLLYELLTGSTPFERKQLNEAAFDEMLRIIREEEPPKPSTKLSSSDTLPSIAASRHTEPAKLSKDVRGELDWIVMKCLEKDRNRRYETANGFAADIERYLRNEPVQACPPSAGYRLRKFARRNERLLATATLGAIALLLVVGSIGWAVRDRAAREELLAQEHAARQAKVSGQLELILADVARLERAEKWSEALISAQRAEPALAAGEAPEDIQTRVRQSLADLELVRTLEEIRAGSGTVWGSPEPIITALAARADQKYAVAFRKAGIDVDTLPVKETTDRIAYRRDVAAAVLPALDDWVAVRSKVGDDVATQKLVDVLRKADSNAWRQRVRDSLARKDWAALENLSKSPDLDQQPAATISFLCAALRAHSEVTTETPRSEKPDGNSEYLGFLLEIDILRRAQWRYPDDYWINHRLGISLIGLGKEAAQEGIGYMRVAVALRPQESHALNNLGAGFSALGEFDRAIACYRRAIEFSPSYSICYINLGKSLGQKNMYEQAIDAYEQAIKLQPDSDGNAYAALAMLLSECPNMHLRNPHRAVALANKAVQLQPKLGDYWTILGVALYREGKWEESRAAVEKSLQLGTRGTGGDNLEGQEAIDWFMLAMCQQQLGKIEEARQYFEKGVGWMKQNKLNSERLNRLHEEAEKLLQIADDKPTPNQESK